MSMIEPGVGNVVGHGGLTEETGTFSGARGTELAYHVWKADRSEQPERVIVFIHGIGSYAAPYRRVAEGIGCEGQHMYALDLRGHGSSGEKRGEFGCRRVVLEDIDRFVDLARSEHPQARLVMSGESMGAMLSLAYAAWRPEKVDALLLVAPAMALRPKWVTNGGSLIGFVRGLLIPEAPTIPLNTTLPECSRDKRFVEECLNDPIPLPSASIRYMWTLFTFTFAWTRRYPRCIKSPVLILQGGDDPLLDPAVPPRLLRLLAATDKELHWVPEAWHTLFSDPQTPLVYTTMTDWLSRH